MSKLAVLPALCLCLWSAPTYAQSDAPGVAAPVTEAGASAVATEPQPAPEQIHVVAQRPGPGLWKVSKGENVMWVFGTYGPLPKNIEWRSHEVERIISGSQEYLSPPGASASAGFFKGLTLLPLMIGMRKNPDDLRLEQVLAPETYARWTLLKSKYMPENDDVERERPMFAAETLMRAARKDAGLVGDDEVRKRVLELAKKNKLKITSTTVELPMDNARTILKNFKKTSLNDAGCLAATMATLDGDIAAASVRGNAWARGNLNEIRKLNFVERDEACFDNVFNSPVFETEPAFKNMKRNIRDKWLALAEKALATNSSTFAVLQIKEALDPKGVIAALAAKGYTVEQPD